MNPIVRSKYSFGLTEEGEEMAVADWKGDKSRHRMASVSMKTSNRPSFGGNGSGALAGRTYHIHFKTQNPSNKIMN